MPNLLQDYACLAIALSERDAYTGAHCGRVQSLARALGNCCDLDDSELHRLQVAARLHDIGKIGVPDAVLLKPGALSHEERSTIQTHCELGQRICLSVPHDDIPEIADIVRSHHEAFDGSGYPDGLRGESIPPLARILALADSYDAMATARPYHRARKHDEVMAMMLGENGNKFDPYLLGKFAHLIEHSEHRADAV